MTEPATAKPNTMPAPITNKRLYSSRLLLSVVDCCLQRTHNPFGVCPPRRIMLQKVNYLKGILMSKCCDAPNQDLKANISKRTFLKGISISALSLGAARLSGTEAFAAAEKPPPKAENVLTPNAAFERLLKGNQRYISGKTRPFDFAKDRAALVGGQNPYASILSCSDARVVPEICFDEQRGDLFVARVAGNYVTSDTLPQICLPVWNMARQF